MACSSASLLEKDGPSSRVSLPRNFRATEAFLIGKTNSVSKDRLRKPIKKASAAELVPSYRDDGIIEPLVPLQFEAHWTIPIPFGR